MRFFRQIIMTSFLSLVLILSLASLCSASEQLVIVKGNYANIRKGPGMSYSIALKAPTSTVLKVVGRQGGWYKVITPPQYKSRTLWVYQSKSVELLTTDAAVQDNAYLYGGPGFEYPIVAKLPKGTPIKVLGKYGIWYKVIPTDLNLKATPFWVTAKMDLVKFDNEPAPAAAPTAPAPAAAPPAATPPTPTATPVGQRWLYRNTLGRFVILDDSSYYRIAPGDQDKVLEWSPGDNISVVKSGNASYPVTLQNTARGDEARALVISQ